MLRSIGILKTSMRAFSTARPLFNTQTPVVPTLTWNEYFQKKKERSWINTSSGITTSFLSTTAAWAYISTVTIDPTLTMFGMDPLMALFGGMMLSTATGYMVGASIIGDLVFSLKNRAHMPEFVNKEKIFLERIIKNRPDPSKSNVANPVPDYYGEKIFCLKDYKKWLKDCNTYKTRSHTFL
ncbi:hypothetical protein BABINDRAFT_164533 [Babjeviella inositovora NRRL Y-12698]|uniref:Presequence translocated-associated motor subunit PAM17 n=1 Tax=Babjeviella inositovora NRRL Y-12698 TaxID=984486 RepID=A0A1E3QYT7_9ASCO|nr:uncharacterized protein BABINDRAFT_164533 [Babjeviella inositovora NRRL Y-12698]ODQ82796.1 hypothetical protein BABINDRAFT_164533 [Babjeviella inositovora NRRL Y-12698]